MKKTLILSALVFVSAVACASEAFSPIGISFTGGRNEDTQIPSKRNYVYGGRLALFGGAHERMIGLAVAGGGNTDGELYDGYTGGLQAAGFFNMAHDGELGIWQVAGLFNTIRKGGNGLQVASIYNEAGDWFCGVQIGIGNRGGDDFRGTQLGVFNGGKKITGVQLGVFNWADKLVGVQLGLLNFVKDSDMEACPLLRIGW